MADAFNTYIRTGFGIASFSEIVFHPPTLAAVSAFLLAIAAPAWGFWPRRQAGVHRERTAA